MARPIATTTAKENTKVPKAQMPRTKRAVAVAIVSEKPATRVVTAGVESRMIHTSQTHHNVTGRSCGSFWEIRSKGKATRLVSIGRLAEKSPPGFPNIITYAEPASSTVENASKVTHVSPIQIALEIIRKLRRFIRLAYATQRSKSVC